MIYGEAELTTRFKKGFDTAAAAVKDGLKHAKTKRDQTALLTNTTMQIVATFAIPLALIAKEEQFRVEAEVRGTYIAPARHRSGPRPDFQFVDLSPENITTVYLGKRADIQRVRRAFESAGQGPEFVPASYY